MRRPLRSAVLVVGIVVLGACSADGRTSVPIATGAGGRPLVEVSPDGRTLRFSISMCGTKPTVRVREADSTVRLLVTADPRRSSKCAFADPVSATLREPLGNRTVIDDKIGSVFTAAVSSSYASSGGAWCVAISRAQAVARGVSYGNVIVDMPRARAKLVGVSELERGKGGVLSTLDPRNPLADHDKFWVVELKPTSATTGPYSWGLVALDANTGAIVTENSGPSTGPGITSEPKNEPPYWNSLPDHAAQCSVDTKGNGSTGTP